ncbi:MAG: hydrogenase maturation protease [Anaerolineales bacterium]|nr:hydrogenase maturation protease [Anaerolineales bacterium]MCX7609125.1 hydrogenase maturation protease [Anaerolineales bacterium]
MKTLVIGLGNPILGDDGVGWVVAQQVEEQFADKRTDLEFDYLSLGGLSLMERMIGYRRVLIIDSLTTGKYPLGTVMTFTLADLPDLSSGHTTAAHDTSLKTALETGRRLGAELPDDGDIHIVAIEAQQVYNLQEGLTPPIAAAVPQAVQAVLALLEKISPKET